MLQKIILFYCILITGAFASSGTGTTLSAASVRIDDGNDLVKAVKEQLDEDYEKVIKKILIDLLRKYVCDS